MPGRSILVSISILWTFNPKQVAGGFRGLFCDPIEGVLKFWFGEHFCMGVNHSGKNFPVFCVCRSACILT